MEKERIIFCLFVFGLLLACYEIFFWWRRWRKRSVALGGNRLAAGVHVLALLSLSCFSYARLVEPFWMQVHRIEMTSPKIRRTELKIAQISDLHSEAFVGNEEKVVEIINAFAPDIIVFTGDAVNSPEGIPTFQRTLRRLRARLGKYAVRGNWDFKPWAWGDLFSGTGFQLIEGRTVFAEKNGERFSFSGGGLLGYRYRKQVFSAIPKDTFNVFLYHTPDLVEEAKNYPIDLYLCGHTHGGQVALPFYGALLTMSKFGKKYEAGLYSLGQDRKAYVNRGVGVEGGAPRVRFFVRPEVALFTIKPTGQ